MNMIKFSYLFSSYLFSILFSTIYFLGKVSWKGSKAHIRGVHRLSEAEQPKVRL